MTPCGVLVAEVGCDMYFTHDGLVTPTGDAELHGEREYKAAAVDKRMRRFAVI